MGGVGAASAVRLIEVYALRVLHSWILFKIRFYDPSMALELRLNKIFKEFYLFLNP